MRDGQILKFSIDQSKNQNLRVTHLLTTRQTLLFKIEREHISQLQVSMHDRVDYEREGPVPYENGEIA